VLLTNIQVIKSGRMRGEECGIYGRAKKLIGSFGREARKKEPLRRPGCRFEDDIN
jgi:hypothetical protein